MKFNLSNLIGFGDRSGGDGSYSKLANLKKLHRNLFMDDIHQNSENDDDDDYIDDEEFDNGVINQTDNEYKSTIETNSKYFKLNHLSMPLTDTIAQFAYDLSDDEFFINDLSFIFDMSRKRAISPYAIIVALLYLKRLKTKHNQTNNLISKENGNLIVDSSSNELGLSNTDLCLVSILLASKFLTDEGESNEIYNNDWAEACDIPVKKINSLERIFLKKMNWDLYVSSEEFWSFTTDLTEKITRKKIKSQSNQCTYSDLDYLLSYSKEFSLESIKNHLSLLSKVLIVCSSTLIYITFSSLLISTYFAYLKAQIINSIHLTSLTPSMNNIVELNNTSLIDNTSANSIKKDDNEIFSLDDNVEENIGLVTNKSVYIINKNEPFCYDLNHKLVDIDLKLYRNSLLPFFDAYSNNKFIDNHRNTILTIHS